MKKQINEIKRMQQLAGILKEYMSVNSQGELEDSGEDIEYKLGTITQRSIDFNNPDTLTGKINNLLDQLNYQNHYEEIEDLWDRENRIEMEDPNYSKAFYDWLINNFERLKNRFN